MLIYVAGPYSAPTEEEREHNTRMAGQVGLALMRLGHQVVVPHLSHYLDKWAKEDGDPMHYERWMELDLAIVPRCDALFRMAGASPGADREVACAHEHGITVFVNILEVPRVEA